VIWRYYQIQGLLLLLLLPTPLELTRFRNCLVRVDENSYVAVVGDFGLAEKIPNYSDGSEKQPLAVVGSPFWMAPEVLRGELYNEKADVFAYGIILCEIIARIQADPDYMPRTEDFGLDVAAFQNLVGDCPLPFLCLAVDCCDMDSTRRPAFTVITQRLEIILDQHREPGEGTRLTATHGNQTRSQVRRPTCSLRVQCETRLSRSHSDMFSPKPLAAGSEDDQFSPLQRAPTRINPFSRREDLKGGKIKLYDSPSKSVISLTFDLPAPASYQMNLPVTPEPMMDVRCEFPRPNFQPRNCRSLPSSPALSRRNLVHFDFSAPLPSRYWMGTEGGSEPPAGEGPEPTACSSGPVEAPTIAMDNQPWPLLVNDKTATVARYDQPWEPLVNDKMAAVARDDGHVVVSKPQHSETEDGDDGGQGEEDGSPGTENTESSPPGIEQDDMLSCPGCCLGGFTFPSLCLRPSAGTSRYRNLNCDSERLKENPAAKASARTGPGLKITQS
uniref:Testis associated actin remodelling kinase 1 n=1 Tax=Callorhinchus milii TaxID=7868 RepID=A0A4W3IIH1_CALMI